MKSGNYLPSLLAFGERPVGLILVLFFIVETLSAAPQVSQSIELKAGWNAIYLEVQPETNTPAVVFADVPIASVWNRISPSRPTEFFQDLSEKMHNDPAWLVFFPTDRREKMFNNLFRIFANQVYFIKLAGTNDFTWNVSGRPAVADPELKPNRFNLAGFPLAINTVLPTLQDFFAPSTALNGQEVYRLNSTGAWTPVTAAGTERMRSGEAMWVYAASGTDYVGPVQVLAPSGDGLDYGATVNELTLQISNLADAQVTVNIRNLAGAGEPLVYWSISGTDVSWNSLPDPLTLNIAAGDTAKLRLAMRRENFTGALYETTLEVTSGLGTRIWIPVTARRL